MPYPGFSMSLFSTKKTLLFKHSCVLNDTNFCILNTHKNRMNNICPALLDIGALKTKQDTWEAIMWVMIQGHKK